MMKKTEKDFAAFERLMHEEKIYLDRSITFEKICERIGADPQKLDCVLRSELGFSGQSLVDLYRSQERRPDSV